MAATKTATEKKPLCMRCKRRPRHSRKCCQKCLKLNYGKVYRGEKTDDELVAEKQWAPAGRPGRPRKSA